MLASRPPSAAGCRCPSARAPPPPTVPHHSHRVSTQPHVLRYGSKKSRWPYLVAAADGAPDGAAGGAVAAAPEAAAPAAAPPVEEPPISAADIAVGRIISCEKHPDADSLYVEQIECGEAEPRTIVSGLVAYVPLEEMQGRHVVIIRNLKPRNMRGIKSAGMVLCASSDTHVQPLVPPPGAAIGERVWFGEDQQQGDPLPPNRVEKKKVWEALQPHLRTDAEGVAGFKGAVMRTSAGVVSAVALPNASIS